MAKRKNKPVKKLKLRFVEDEVNNNEFYMLVNSSTTIGRIKDIHSKFQNVRTSDLIYKHGGIELKIGDQSLEDLKIKNNDTILFVFAKPACKRCKRPCIILVDENYVPQFFYASRILKETIEFAIGEKFCCHFYWGLETRAFFKNLFEIIEALEKGVKKALKDQVGKCLVLSRDDQGKCLTMPDLALEKVVSYMIQNSISEDEAVLIFEGDCCLKDMMDEASKLMKTFCLCVNVDLRHILHVPYMLGTLSYFKQQMYPNVPYSMKYFDCSLNISSKVIDLLTSMSIPDVNIEFVKKSRRNAQEALERQFKEHEAFKVIPVLDIG